MRFRLAPRSMTLDDLDLHKFEFLENLSEFRRFRTQQQLNELTIDQYCQRQRCKHVELEQFFDMLSRRAGLSATAGLLVYLYA